MTTTETERRPTHWIVQVEDASVDFAVKTFWGLATVHGRFDLFTADWAEQWPAEEMWKARKLEP